MTDATMTAASLLAQAMREDDRCANTGPDDEDYTYYGPLLRGAPTFTAADLASLQAAEARRDGEHAAQQERISTIRAALLAGEERVAALEAQLALADQYGRACYLAGQYGGESVSFSVWREAYAAWKERESQAWGIAP